MTRRAAPTVGTRLPVTVIIPAYNREQLLERALRSVERQTALPDQVIVVDDGSTDGTAGVATRFGAEVVRHERNQGAGAARNTAIAKARHEWLAPLDSDDEWLPWHLETLWPWRDGHVLVAGSALHLDRQGRPLRVNGPADWRDRTVTSPLDLLYPENIIPASAALVSRRAVEAVGGYDAMLNNSEDFDLWTRVVTHGSAQCLAAVTTRYHRHAGQKSHNVSRSLRSQAVIAARLSESPRTLRAASRRRGTRLWDDARARARAKDFRGAIADLWELIRRPTHLLGAVGAWPWRRQTRRRARGLLADGRARVVVLPATTPPDGLDEERVAVEIHRRARPSVYVGLFRSPPRRVYAARRWQRVVCRAAGVDVEAWARA